MEILADELVADVSVGLGERLDGGALGIVAPDGLPAEREPCPEDDSGSDRQQHEDAHAERGAAIGVLLRLRHRRR